MIYHGLPHSDVAKKKAIISLPEKFLLFVGERGHYKSFEPFITAIIPLLNKDTSLKVIAAGGKPFMEN